MNLVKRILLILFVLVTCVGCDQSTKTYAESNLPKAQALSFLADTVRLQVAHNDGAFLSLGESAPKSWRLAALRVGVSALLLTLLGYLLLIRVARPSFILALTLILAGGVSNLIDRFTHGGYVVDFINLGIGSLRTGIFNVADIAITLGVFMLLVQNWRIKKNGF
jgi:signal peptidase II